MKKFLFLLAVAALAAGIYAAGVKKSDSSKGAADKPGAEENVTPVPTPRIEAGKYKVVLDAGHGGFDPGKVSADNILEKDINLAVVLKLSEYLKANGIEVVLTRENDAGLYSENDQNKKAADLKKRVEIMENAKPDLIVSIHQNSYTDSSSRGAQVFYYKGSSQGCDFANLMQSTIKEIIGDGNHREAKDNTSYYLLKKTSTAIIIVECGFLSNPSEASLLASEEYQEKIAGAVGEGIIRYLEREEHGDNNKED